MIKIDLGVWHYKVWKHWSNKVYSSTLTSNNFFDDGRVHHQETFFYINDDGVQELIPANPAYCYYVKMQKGNQLFILPRDYLDKLPVNPVSTTQIRLKKSDTIIWNLITKVDSLKIPAKKRGTYKEFVDKWNPVEHENTKTWTVLKLLALSSGVKCGVCGPVGSGKNANLTLLRHIRKTYAPKVNKPTKAMFYRTMYFNEHINIDEITSWTVKQVSEIEDLIVDVADDSPDMDKYSLDNNKAMETMDLSSKSVTFSFNPVTSKNPEPFHTKFMNADKILDRYPLFLFDGKVLTNMPDKPAAEFKHLMETNFKEMCDVVSEEQYWRTEYYKHLHNYSTDNLILERRHLNNITPLLNKLDLYSDTQEEFNDWINFLNNAFIKFKEMSGEEHTPSNMKVEEVPIEDVPGQKPIYHKDKVVGHVKDKVYFKKCTKEHFMVKYQGFGISEDVIANLVVNRINNVTINYINSKGEVEVYSSALDLWQRSIKTHDDNGDMQRFVSIKDMTKVL